MVRPKPLPSDVGKSNERAITVKYNGYVDQQRHYYSLYNHWFESAKRHGLKWQWGVIEFDSKEVLHIHGIVTVPKSFKYTDVAIDGFHSKFKPITSVKAWKAYCEGWKHDENVNYLFVEERDTRFIPGMYEYFKPKALTPTEWTLIQYYGVYRIRDQVRKDLDRLALLFPKDAIDRPRQDMITDSYATQLLFTVKDKAKLAMESSEETLERVNDELAQLRNYI